MDGGTFIPRFVGRTKVRDNMLTFDGFATDGLGNQRGQPLPFRCRTHDGKWVDSTGAFLVGELERLDLTLHEPLAAVSYLRDVQLREDVTIADEASSFTISTYGSQGGLGAGQGIGTGKAWAGKTSTEVATVSVDIGKIPHPLRLWVLEVSYTIPELESAAKLGRPIDRQKWAAMQLKHQMDTDEQVYIGDTSTGDTGLMNWSSNSSAGNATNVTNVANVAASGSGPTTWASKSPDEILADVNEILTSNWAQAAWAVMADKLLIPPAQFGQISTQKVSNAGNVSVLRYILENNVLTGAGSGQKLDIKPVKWAIGSGVGGTIGTTGTTDRMIAYSNDKERLRYPMTLLQRTPIQYDGIYHKTTYFGRLGVLEIVFPDTVAYRDGI